MAGGGGREAAGGLWLSLERCASSEGGLNRRGRKHRLGRVKEESVTLGRKRWHPDLMRRDWPQPLVRRDTISSTTRGNGECVLPQYATTTATSISIEMIPTYYRYIHVYQYIIYVI